MYTQIAIGLIQNAATNHVISDNTSLCTKQNTDANDSHINFEKNVRLTREH